MAKVDHTPRISMYSLMLKLEYNRHDPQNVPCKIELSKTIFFIIGNINLQIKV